MVLAIRIVLNKTVQLIMKATGGTLGMHGGHSVSSLILSMKVPIVLVVTVAFQINQANQSTPSLLIQQRAPVVYLQVVHIDDHLYQIIFRIKINKYQETVLDKSKNTTNKLITTDPDCFRDSTSS